MKGSQILSRRVISLFMTILMLSSMMILPHSVEAYVDGDIIASENYNGYSNGAKISNSTSSPDCQSGTAYAGSINGEKAWNLNTSNGAMTMRRVYLGGRSPKAAEIKTGSLVCEYDLFYPTPSEPMGAGDKVGHYALIWPTNSSDTVRAYLTYSRLVVNDSGTGHEAQIWFPVSSIHSPNTDPTSASVSAVSLTLDTWHHVAHYINYAEGKIQHVVDGKLVATTTDNITTKAALDYFDLVGYHNAGTSNSFTGYIDNFAITYGGAYVPSDTAALVDSTGKTILLLDGAKSVATDIMRAEISFGKALDPISVEQNVRVTTTADVLTHNISAEGNKVVV